MNGHVAKLHGAIATTAWSAILHQRSLLQLMTRRFAVVTNALETNVVCRKPNATLSSVQAPLFSGIEVKSDGVLEQNATCHLVPMMRSLVVFTDRLVSISSVQQGPM